MPPPPPGIGASFSIKVTSPTQPGVTSVTGGTITVTDNGDGTWQLTSTDIITYFVMDTNKADITKVEIINEELTSLDSTFRDLTNMTEFVAPSTAFGNVTDFHSAWHACMNLVSFPSIDTSKAITFRYAWYYCSKLPSLPALNTSSATNFSYAWKDCLSLKCMQKVDTTSATDVTDMFQNCNVLCRPNATEQAQIAQTPGINWVSDVPEGEDCCPITSKINLGDTLITSIYLGDVKVPMYLGDEKVV